MRTVKQVSDLTGISVRALHYYDEIGLLKPSRITDADYRLYDDEAIKTLQQILFFKELDIHLKDIKEIMCSPYFDKMQALENQKRLLVLKKKRLDGLIELIDKTLKGESTMDFKEFDMSEYYDVLEEFKKEHEDKIIKNWGGMDKYNELIEKCKSKEAEIAESAIKQYGSVKKYAEAVKKNLNSAALTLAEQYDNFKKDCLEDKNPALKELFGELASDLTKDPCSMEIQNIAEEISATAKKDYELFGMDNGDDYWYYMAQNYLVNPEWTEAVDKKYESGACRFIGEALKYSLREKQPKINTLYDSLVFDLSKDPRSDGIQAIVKEIADLTKKQQESLNVDMGNNYWGYMAGLYLSKPEFIKAIDKKYGNGASVFMGEAFKFYSESIK